MTTEAIQEARRNFVGKMSLVSYPKTEVVYDLDKTCDPAKITLTFRETSSAPPEQANGLPKPQPIKNAKKMPFKGIEIPKTEEDFESVESAKRRKKAESMRRRKEEFLERGVVMALYGAVEQKVKCACMSTDHLLFQKRTRLRELLLAEEVAYTTEYIAMCQQVHANKEEELQKRAFELQEKYERERKQFVDQKLLEHVVETSETLRPVLVQKYLKEIKQDQLWQIKEKYALQEAKREEDKMYHDLMIKNMLAMKENDEENAKLAWIKRNDTIKNFQEQIKWKEEKEKKKKELKELEKLELEEEIRLIKQEKEKEQLDKIKRREIMKAEIKELLDNEKGIKQRKKREEEEIDKMFAKLLKIEEEKEKSKQISEKERLKREMDIFLEKSRELKRQREEEERKLNETLEELNEKKRQQKDAERRKLREAREELFTSVLREREEQIRAKRDRQKREEEQKQLELELLNLQIEQQKKIREDYERKCAEEREKYRCQLIQQIREVEEARLREKEEEEKSVRRRNEREKMEIERVKDLLQNLPVKGLDHPMKTIIKQNPPMYMPFYPCPK